VCRLLYIPTTPATITVISVRNLADSDLEVSAGQLLAPGVPCSPENSTTEVSNFSIRASKLMPFQLAVIKDQLGPDLEEEQRKQILELINEFRDFRLNHR
jgi:hypothetical protein